MKNTGMLKYSKTVFTGYAYSNINNTDIYVTLQPENKHIMASFNQVAYDNVTINQRWLAPN